MKSKSDAVPELIILDERSRRQTAELCGDPAHGLRCTLLKGHTGTHECVALRGAISWESSKAS
jgi:hypothetical protein